MSDERQKARSLYDADRPAAWGRGEMSEERIRVAAWLERLEFRPYSALRTTQKIRKALLPLRNAIVWRALFELPRRVSREVRAQRGAMEFEYGRLTPNLDEYVGTDSDAFTSMDPRALAIWFTSRGWKVVSHPDLRARMLARHEPVVVRKP